MKKGIALLSLLPILCLCNQVEPVENGSNNGGKVSIAATIGDIAGTKVSVKPAADGLTLAWQQGDQLKVVGSTSGVFDITDGFSAHSASFTGKAVEGKIFDIIYPAKYMSAELIEARSYDKQTQTGNGSTDHLEFNALIKGASSYTTATFTKGAKNTFINGALKLVISVPATLKNAESVTLSARQAIFYKRNSGNQKCQSLTVDLKNTTIGDDRLLTVYLMTSWQEVTIPAGTDLTVEVTPEGGSSHYSKVYTTEADKTISGGAMLSFNFEDAAIEDDALTGSGTQADPYAIYTPKHLTLMKKYCKKAGSDNGTPTYFILMDDINMTGIDWVPLNTDESADPKYGCKVDFNGNGKTISNLRCSYERYPSLFGVLFGSVHDLKIAGAFIEGDMASGIVGGYAGTNAGFTHSAKVTNVHVSGTVESLSGSVDGVGGMFGRICNTEISRCSANVTVETTGGQVGGIAGYIDKGDCKISNCFSQGKINCPENSQRNAGIVGCIRPQGCTVENCISLCEVVTNMCAASIVGHANENSSSVKSPGNTIKGCIAWSKGINAIKCKTSNYSSGAIVGFTSLTNNLSNCWRRRDLELNINENQTDRATYPLDFITLCDQPDASSSSPLSEGVNFNPDNKDYIAPYHGKAAAEGETATEIAKRTGWDSSIWDFSGDIPVLYNSNVVPAEGGGGSEGKEYVIPGDDIPAHAAVTPSGAGWTKTDVEDGLVYWCFTGDEPVSGAKQFVHVADVDLNKGFELKTAYDANQSITSNIYKKYNAVVAMNGGFGASQIFIKVDGTAFRKIQSEKDDEGILNWRNDGAICVNKEGRVFIANSIFDQNGDSQSEYGRQLGKQRDFYKNTLSSIPYIISGSPLLIDGYNPLGLTFVPAEISMSQAEKNYAYEHPYRHQGVRHPRTAIAITGDNHLLMIVADGRRSTFCNGFTAKELTAFLISNFDPKYALNLDGGGSSTLCIEKNGDPDTHVVNYPCDGNSNLDHTGERTVQSFLYIVKK